MYHLTCSRVSIRLLNFTMVCGKGHIYVITLSLCYAEADVRTFSVLPLSYVVAQSS